MKIREVDILDKNFFNEVVCRYLKNEDFPQELINTDSLPQTIQKLCDSSLFDASWRTILSEELLAQYQHMAGGLSDASPVAKNIALLQQKNCVTVTTGQQIHIFLGPLFVVYKIMSCLAHAEQLRIENPDYQVVPIFWMASEDHDFEEISTIKLYGKTYSWNTPSGGAVGRLSPSSLLPLVEELGQRIDNTDENKRFIEICRTAYSGHETFSSATRYLVHQLFEKHGLVVIDPDSRVLKNRLADNVMADLFDHTNSTSIQQSISQMKHFGIKAPINTRPVNYFLLQANKRIRLENRSGKIYTVEGELVGDKEGIEKLLQGKSELFSPNALMRPLYQQLILPNAIYVTGASEFIYWLELKQNIVSTDCIYPHLKIRKSVFFASAKNWMKWEAIGLNAEDLFSSEEQIALKLSHLSATENSALMSLERDFESSFQALRSWLETHSKITGTKSFEKYETGLKSLIEQGVKTWRLAKIEHDEKKGAALKIKGLMLSEGYVQERNEFVISYPSLCFKIISYEKSDQNLFKESAFAHFLHTP